MKNANKQAYPIAGYEGPSYYGSPVEGVTKREYFAAMALQGILANSGVDVIDANNAKYAVRRADALLEELERPVRGEIK